jgi:UDP-N-acetylglucosamine 2-epimerase (non-hydrolysing)
MTHKAMCIVGTRPEAIKMAPVIKKLQQDPRYECIVCATGQHKEMLYQILDWFDIVPDYKMDVMLAGQPLSHLAGKLLSGLHDLIDEVNPEFVFVHGDTTTAFVSALAAHYAYNASESKHMKVVHVEAGLRTYDKHSPFPEESNRVLIGQLADWHFTPTITSAEALLLENITKNVYVVGNTVIDALYDTVDLLKTQPRDPLSFVPEGEKVILVTAHRRESYGEGFKNICTALKELSILYPNTHIVYPVHLNPNVKDVVNEMIKDIPNIHLIPPMDYPDFVAAMLRSHIILTDSGGIQEEAPSLGKPVLVLRDVTERPEAVSAGTVKLVGTDPTKIIDATSALLDDEKEYSKMAKSVNPYGDGQTSGRIVNILAGDPVKENTFRIQAA